MTRFEIKVFMNRSHPFVGKHRNHKDFISSCSVIVRVRVVLKRTTFFHPLLSFGILSTFFHSQFIIHILSSAFYHPHLIIHILSSSFYHPHFSSTFCHPHFTIHIFLPAILHPVLSLHRPVLLLFLEREKFLCCFWRSSLSAKPIQ